MPTQIKSTFVYTQNDDGLIMIGFADDQFETNEYILLQRSAVVTKEDIDLGQDNIHITHNDQEFSGYGGIEKMRLKDNLVEIELSDNMKEIINTDNIIKIDISQATANLDELADKMALICEGFATFIDERS